MILGIVGLLFLCVRLFLIVQVMLPHATSFADVQGARTRRRPFRSALVLWRHALRHIRTCTCLAG